MRDDDIDGIVGQRDVFDFAFEKLDVFHSGLALVFAGQGQHFVGHIEAVGFAGRADAPGGEQHVDAAAGAEIEHGFAGIELGQRGGIAAAERSQHRFFGNLAGLRGIIEIRGDRIAAAIERGRGAAAGASAGGDAQGGLPYFSFTTSLSSMRIPMAPYLHSCTMSRGSTALLRVQHSA